MVLIPSIAREFTDGYVTSYTNTVGLTPVTYTFNDTQDHLKLYNNGSDTITFSVGTYSNVSLGRGKVWEEDVSFNSITLQTNSSSQEFHILAKKFMLNDFTSTNNSISSINTQLADIATMPEKYGAKGDGVNDDTVAILQALNDITTKKAKVLLLNGNYLISKQGTASPYNFFNCPDTLEIDGIGTLKVANNGGSFESIFNFNNASNVVIKNITIDENGGNNIRTLNPNTSPELGVNDRVALKFNTGQNVLIDNVTFLNTSGIWTIEGNGVNNITIKNCKLLNGGIGQTFNYDTSNFYCLGDNVKILNNTMIGSGLGVRTAIELEGNYKLVRGNHIEKFPTGILYVSTNTNSISYSSIIENNNVKEVQIGVELWATSDDMSNVIVAKNNITINNVVAGSSSTQCPGIYFYYPSTNNFKDIVISENTIYYEAISGTDSQNYHSNGIDFAVYGDGNGTITAQNISIENNVIENAYGSGINWSFRGTNRNISVSNNKILNPNLSTSSSAYKSGIDVGGDIFTFENCKCDNNQITSSNAQTSNGITVVGRSGDNHVIHLSVKGNKFSLPTGMKAYVISSTASGLIVEGYSKEFNRDITNMGNGSSIKVGSDTYFYDGLEWYRVYYASTKPTGTATNGDICINTNKGRGTPKQWLFIADTWYEDGQNGYRRATTTGLPTFIPNFIGEECYNLVDFTWYKAINTNATTDWKQITN